MSPINIQPEAEENTELECTFLGFTTEVRFKDGSDTDEEFRSVLRVTVAAKAARITRIPEPTQGIDELEFIDASFRGSEALRIFPIDKAFPFKLMAQSYTPDGVEGSTFFLGSNEYASVSPWAPMDWS